MKRIKIIGLSFLISTFLVSFIFLSFAYPSQPLMIYKTDITDSQVVISWTTEFPEKGYIRYGEEGTDINNLFDVYDERGKDTVSSTHYVRILNLKGKRKYIFQIISGNNIYPSATDVYRFQTGSSLIPQKVSDLIYGKVVDSDKKPLEGILVYVWLQDNDGQDTRGISATMSCLTDKDGIWSIELQNARKPDNIEEFIYSLDYDKLYIYAEGGNLGRKKFSLLTKDDSTPQNKEIEIVLDNEAPPDVSDLKIKSGDNEIILTWNNPDINDFDGVLLLRKEKEKIPETIRPIHGISPKLQPFEGVKIFNIKKDESTFVDKYLKDGIEYNYKIYTLDTSTNYSSGITCKATPEDTQPPPDPSDFKVEVKTETPNMVDFSWKNPDTYDFQGIIILRKTGKDPFTEPVKPIQEYKKGDQIGDATIVYKGKDVSFRDGPLINDTYRYMTYSFDDAEKTKYSEGIEEKVVISDITEPWVESIKLIPLYEEKTQTIKTGKIKVKLIISEYVTYHKLSYLPNGYQQSIEIELNALKPFQDKKYFCEGYMYISSTTPEGKATFEWEGEDPAGNKGSQIKEGESFSIKTIVSKDEAEDLYEFVTIKNLKQPISSCLNIPKGTFNTDVYIIIQKADLQTPTIKEANTKIEDDYTIDGDPNIKLNLVYNITAKDAQQIKEFPKPVTLNLEYPDQTNDGIVDFTTVKERNLKIFYLNEETNLWEVLENSKVNSNENKVICSIKKAGIYSLMSYSPTSREKIFSHPNPCYPDRGEKIKIYNIPKQKNAKVYIYSISGELIRTLEEGNKDEFSILGSSEVAVWDTRNEDGRSVKYGIYIYVVKWEGGIKKGKIAILK